MRLIFCLGGNQKHMALARAAGWWPGARLPSTLYPEHAPLAFADQDWRRFDGLTPEDEGYKRAYDRYVAAVAAARPWMASVIDWERQRPLDEVLTWARAIAPHVSRYVMIIPKRPGEVDAIPDEVDGVPVVLGFSVPTPHGATECVPWEFAGRRVHLLGGSVHDQLAWAPAFRACGAELVSVDGNSFHNGAGFGTYFDGEKFRNEGRRVVATQEALRRSFAAIRQAWIAEGWELEDAAQQALSGGAAITGWTGGTGAMTTREPLAIPLAEAAELLSVRDSRTLVKYAREGRIRIVGTGNGQKVVCASIDEYLKGESLWHRARAEQSDGHAASQGRARSGGKKIGSSGRPSSSSQGAEAATPITIQWRRPGRRSTRS